MISLAPGTKVYLASKPVSMRLGFDGLAALVRPLFAVEPYGGHVFLFRSKSGNYLKALHWDGTGRCLFAKLGTQPFRLATARRGRCRTDPRAVCVADRSHGLAAHRRP